MPDGQIINIDDDPTALEKMLKRTHRLTKDKGGVFGINVMITAEIAAEAKIIIDTAIAVREKNPEMKNHFTAERLNG